MEKENAKAVESIHPELAIECLEKYEYVPVDGDFGNMILMGESNADSEWFDVITGAVTKGGKHPKNPLRILFKKTLDGLGKTKLELVEVRELRNDEPSPAREVKPST